MTEPAVVNTRKTHDSDLDSGLQLDDVDEQHTTGHTHSLTRLGSQLKYNLSTCPAGSKMLIKDWQMLLCLELVCVLSWGLRKEALLYTCPASRL